MHFAKPRGFVTENSPSEDSISEYKSENAQLVPITINSSRPDTSKSDSAYLYHSIAFLISSGDAACWSFIKSSSRMRVKCRPTTAPPTPIVENVGSGYSIFLGSVAAPTFHVICREAKSGISSGNNH